MVGLRAAPFVVNSKASSHNVMGVLKRALTTMYTVCGCLVVRALRPRFIAFIANTNIAVLPQEVQSDSEALLTQKRLRHRAVTSRSSIQQILITAQLS